MPILSSAPFVLFPPRLARRYFHEIICRNSSIVGRGDRLPVPTSQRRIQRYFHEIIGDSLLLPLGLWPIRPSRNVLMPQRAYFQLIIRSSPAGICADCVPAHPGPIGTGATSN